MKTIFIEIKNSVIAVLVTGFLCCGLYPVVVYGLGQVLFKQQANGSLITGKDGKLLGSSWLSQNFASDQYFHPRASAAGTGYDATSSGGTNLGPTSQKLIDSVKAAVEQYRKENNLPADALVPADAVTSSASGLDPHISLKNAEIQVARVAKARNMDSTRILAMVKEQTDGRSLGVFGEPGVNVLKLNLALDGH